MWILVLIIFIFIITVFESFVGGKKRGPNELYLGDVYFDNVKKGKKTLDVRAGNNKNIMDLEGKDIIYYHKKDTVTAHCSKIVKYKTIDELIKNEDAHLISPHFKTKAESENNLKEYYTNDKIKDMGGLLLLHIKVKK